MLQVSFLNDWRSTVYGCFHFNHINIEFTVGRIALFQFHILPTFSELTTCCIIVAVLGIGVVIDLWQKEGSRGEQ